MRSLPKTKDWANSGINGLQCDAVVPVCGGCQRARVDCIEGGMSGTFPLDPVPQAAHTRDGWNPARDVTDQLGLVSVIAGADLRYLGPSSGLFFTSGVDVTPIDHFQIFMVLAIGVTIRSRQAKVLLSAEGYCASAILHLDAIFHKSSLRGGSAFGPFIITLAAVMELGLHRNVQGSAFTEFDQEMRTRAFWCVYMMDRYLSTILGRSIGLNRRAMQFEGTSLLPREINDEDLKPNQEIPALATGAITDMSSAIHLFKLARFNAEIKCVLFCVDRNYLPYTPPAITDVKRWQEHMLNRLRQWKSSIPCHPPDSPACYLNDLLEIKYHELVMLVSLFLCVMTIFYCVWAPDGVGEETDLDTVLYALKSAGQDVLSGITRATVRRFAQSLVRAGQSAISHPMGESHRSLAGEEPIGSNILDTRGDVTGIGEAKEALFDSYYVPLQQPTATSEILSFFAGPQSETTLDWLNTRWDTAGGMGDIMKDLVSGGY
ncbi:hypothetical protein ASPACDRAFT_64233 [Aspergillus aculeatus ATCC 16872]|uniref:Xylanolytic transcriptional activator regulatory domain-containing protein n=1 Tax=Aspergillus aculeatus (strain ATCC 16872 / CBS 172.66 / WB 5094) TaxID=690307 RepID=A0A1L9WHX6_ASPA1|nr:uncharacterized protein ASPACDRAFT_64233 [Aspergillus aculeatus ATCC 16872]OJJ95756.1 hypothetical protein ASPACDRAFT_64233 [Aspergillus aculeatus ATCC 16872]